MNDEAITPEAAENQAEAPDPAIVLGARTLMGDLRDLVLSEIRELRDPWHKLSESQQGYVAQRVEDRCRGIVSDAVNLVAAHDFPALSVLLEQVNFKPKGIEAKLSFNASSEVCHQLVDARNKQVMIVVSDPDAFHGARGPAKITPQALFDAPPVEKDDGDGEVAGPLFASAADEAAEAVDPALALDAQREDTDESPAYEEGWRAAQGGTPFERNPFRADTLSHVRWDAGWLEGNLVGVEQTSGGKAVKKMRADARKYFRDLGRDAALSGVPGDANPFPTTWPAHEGWASGWLAGTKTAGDLAASDAAATGASEQASAS